MERHLAPKKETLFLFILPGEAGAGSGGREAFDATYTPMSDDRRAEFTMSSPEGNMVQRAHGDPCSSGSIRPAPVSPLRRKPKWLDPNLGPTRRRRGGRGSSTGCFVGTYKPYKVGQSLSKDWLDSRLDGVSMIFNVFLRYYESSEFNQDLTPSLQE